MIHGVGGDISWSRASVRGVPLWLILAAAGVGVVLLARKSPSS